MVKVEYGTNPPFIRIITAHREPIVLWDHAAAANFVNDLNAAYHTAFEQGKPA